ncbi:MAG TPA: hypothetical protein VMK42_14010 [Anaeromyxobacteraceae bacterium]|nr:hypothetical protein [Anaeromyxobacteraceae bacterium]
MAFLEAPLATLAYLQDQIEAINGVRAPPVQGYLVTREEARAAGAEPRASEELLVRGANDGVDVGLFLDEGVVAAATSAALDHHGARFFSRQRLNGVACAAEGVSHFVYLSTRAVADRPVSLLELEVQAEVDKFALFVLHLWRRGLRRLSAALRHRLFERVRYHAHLGQDELRRYRTANGLAAGYARWLEGRFVTRADSDGLFRELRATYRRGAGEKMGYLGSRV